MAIDCALVETSADHWDLISRDRKRFALRTTPSDGSASDAAVEGTSDPIIKALRELAAEGDTVGLFPWPNKVLSVSFDASPSSDSVAELDDRRHPASSNRLRQRMRREIPWPDESYDAAWEVGRDGGAFAVCMQRHDIEPMLRSASASGLLPTLIVSPPLLVAAVGLQRHLRTTRRNDTKSTSLQITWLETAEGLDVVCFASGVARRWWRLPTPSREEVQQLVARLALQIPAQGHDVQLLMDRNAKPARSLESMVSRRGVQVVQISFPTLEQCLPEASDVMRDCRLPNLCQGGLRGRSAKLNRLHRVGAALLAGLVLLCAASLALVSHRLRVERQGERQVDASITKALAKIPTARVQPGDDLAQVETLLQKQLQRIPLADDAESALVSLQSFFRGLPENDLALLTDLRAADGRVAATFLVQDFQGIENVLDALAAAGVKITSSQTQHNRDGYVTLELEATVAP